MKTSLLLILLTATAPVYAQSQPVTETVRMDPAASIGATSSNFFSEVEFIPLETTKESLFNRIAELQVTDQYFVIYDHGGNKVLLFHKNGKFHRKINLNAANATILDGFSLDRTKQEIVVRTRQKKDRFLFFDFNGKFVREENGDSIRSYFTMLGDGFIAHQNSYANARAREDGTNYDLLISNGVNSVVKKELPYLFGGKDLDGLAFFTNPFTYSPQLNQFVYSKLEDYSMHLFDRSGIHKTYRFVLPAERSLPQNFLTDSSMVGKRYQFINENPNKVYKLNNNYFLNGYLLMQLETMGGMDRDRILLYSTATKRVYSFGKITPDSVTCFIPVANRGSDILATDKECFYTTIGAPVLFKARESAKGPTVYSPALETFFSKGSKMDNPVLIRLKPKPGL